MNKIGMKTCNSFLDGPAIYIGDLIDLMNFLVKELKRINPTVDLEEVSVENCVSKRFQKILQSQMDVVWDQLSSKTKMLIRDLQILRSLML